MDLLKIVVGLAGIGYIISPIDAIPEAVFGPFGFADDAVISFISWNFIFEGAGREDLFNEVTG